MSDFSIRGFGKKLSAAIRGYFTFVDDLEKQIRGGFTTKTPGAYNPIYSPPFIPYTIKEIDAESQVSLPISDTIFVKMGGSIPIKTPISNNSAKNVRISDVVSSSHYSSLPLLHQCSVVGGSPILISHGVSNSKVFPLCMYTNFSMDSKSSIATIFPVSSDDSKNVIIQREVEHVTSGSFLDVTILEDMETLRYISYL